MFADRRRSNRTLGSYKACLPMLSYSSGHKQAQYDYQIYRELQVRTRLQAKSYRTTIKFTRDTVINNHDVLTSRCTNKHFTL